MSSVRQLQDETHEGDALAKPSAPYQDFLTVWKDADPDIPILKQAKAENAKLQSFQRLFLGTGLETA